MKERRKDLSASRRASWKALVKRQRTSGLTIAAFCRKEGVSDGTFYQWQTHLRTRPDSRRSRPKRSRPPKGNRARSSFVEVLPGLSASTLMEVVCSPVPVIRLTGPVERGLVAEILAAIRRGPSC